MGLVGLVHTTRLVVEPVHDAVAGPDSERGVNHVLDEGILRRLTELGEITPEIVDWLTDMVESTQSIGADCAVVSCSSLSPCVNEVNTRLRIPVLKVDEPMVEYAVANAQRIGLVMTNPTTEAPSTLLVREVSSRLSRTVDLVPKLCPDAFAKLNRGDIEAHDAEVVETIEQLLEEVDLVMLAQISIARVRSRLDSSASARVLSSLDFIGEKINQVLRDA
jgi:aspartate/glutamate racemase